MLQTPRLGHLPDRPHFYPDYIRTNVPCVESKPTPIPPPPPARPQSQLSVASRQHPRLSPHSTLSPPLSLRSRPNTFRFGTSLQVPGVRRGGRSHGRQNTLSTPALIQSILCDRPRFSPFGRLSFTGDLPPGSPRGRTMSLTPDKGLNLRWLYKGIAPQHAFLMPSSTFSQEKLRTKAVAPTSGLHILLHVK